MAELTWPGDPSGGVNLGRALPTVEGVFEQMGAAPPPPAASMGSGMGAAAAQLFPTVAAMPVTQAPPSAPRQSSGLGAAAAAPSQAAPPQLGALDAAKIGNATQIDALSAYLAANPIVRGSTANPMRDVVKKSAQRFEGGGDLPVPAFQPQPFQPPPMEGDETDFEYQERVEALQAADLQKQQEQYGQQVAQMREDAMTLGDVRDIGKQGHLGMGEATLQAQEGVGEAEIEQQKQVAQVKAQAAQMSMDATEAARQADIERREQARAQLDNLDAMREVQTNARKKLENLPELDPQRFWKSQSGASKFFAVIGAMAGGAIGSTAVPEHFERMAVQDLEAQKANAAQAFDTADAADKAVSQQVGIYREMLDATGSERAADAMMLQLQLEDAQRLLEAQLAETTVPVMRQQLQQAMVGMKERIDAQQRVIDTELATTRERIPYARDTLGARQRKRIEGRIDKLMDQDFELEKLGIGSEEKAIEREGKLALEGAKQERQELRGEGGVYREAAQLADKIAEKQAIVAEVDEILAMETFPGFGPFPLTETISSKVAGMVGGKDEAHALKKRIQNVSQRTLRDETGAAAPESDVEELKDRILEGSEDIGGEARLRSNLEEFKRGLEGEIDVMVRGRSPEAVEFLTRNKAIPERDAINVGKAPARQVVRVK